MLLAQLLISWLSGPIKDEIRISDSLGVIEEDAA
jgi:hypothetical protein